MEIFSACASLLPTIDKYIFEPLTRRVSYAFTYTTKIAELKRNVQTLIGARDNLRNSVEDARRRGDEIQKNVEEWLADAARAIEGAERFIEEEEEAKKQCFAGLCPNLKVRYQLGEKAVKESLTIVSLENEGRFDRGQISYRAPLQQIVTSSVNCLEGLPSRESKLKEVMDALKDTDVNVIGLYGMGGTGKSTLASEVQRQAIDAKLFDCVVMATVSENPKFDKIQGKIADDMGLELKEVTVEGRACRLHQKLKEKEKILVILDNLWTAVELKAIGIPSRDEHKGCKMLLTSRDQNVLIGGMGRQKLVKLEPLPEDEAWKLFKITVDNSNTQQMPTFADQVAAKCGGIPLAIVTVAKVLRDKKLQAWKDALNQLSMTSRFDSTGIQAEVYAALELSFNHLVAKEVKSLFLLFPLLPYSSICIMDLLKYGVGLGLFESIDSVEDARNRLLKLIDDLKASCFLQDSDVDGFVDMHDFVRAFAMSIVSRDQNAAFIKTDIELKEFAERRITNRCTRLSLLLSDPCDLPEDLKCPELEFLLVEGNCSLRIPDSFFSGTRKLQVLDCSGVAFSCLPQSLGLLTSLHTLCLDRCVLSNIAMVGALKKLEILSLLGSEIVELPKEIGQLSQLKLLDLTNCRKLRVIPTNVLSQLSLLEELYTCNSFVNWEVKGLDNQTNASICELEQLSRLAHLAMDFPDVRKLPKGLFFERLERFKISIGDGWNEWDWYETYQTSTTLKLKLGTSIYSWDLGVKTLLKKAEDLYLDEVKGVTNVLYDLHKEGFPQLKHLLVQNGGEIRYIIDSEGQLPFDAFPVLESLILHSLVNLEKICRGQLMAGDFCQLRILRVRSCNKLKNLFSFSMLGNLKQLREMEVKDCSGIEEIFAGETEEEGDKNGVFEFTQLCSLELQLPLLRRFCSKVKSSPASTFSSHSRQNQSTNDPWWPLFNEMIVFPNLKELKLSSIIAENIWWNQLGDHASFYNLTSLTVEACKKITYLFTSAIVRNLGQLQRLEICECTLMEGVIAAEGETISETSFPKLEFLKLKGLSKLVRFCNGDFMELPCLKELRIENCPALNSFVSNPSATASGANLALFDEKVAFPNLEILLIDDMNGLKMIWHNELREGSFCKLKTLTVRHAEELVNVFPANMLMSRFLNLENLHLAHCELLEEIFDLPPHEEPINFKRTHRMSASQLKTLYIRYLPNLKCIRKKDAREREIMFFLNLHAVYVAFCPSLKSIFPCSIATNLLQLKELKIINCGIEEIFDRGEDKLRIEFPELTSLELCNLGELKTLYPGAHTSIWPKLEKLGVLGCPEVELFSLESGSIGGKGGRSHSENPSRQPFFTVDKLVFPYLEELKLSSIKVEEMWSSQLMDQSSIFKHLTILIVEDCDNLRYLFTYSMVEYLDKIERLDICNCKSIKEVVLRRDVGDGENWCKMQFPKLKVLKLTGLPKVTTFCTCNLFECPVLKELQIDSCPQLKSLVSDPTGLTPRGQIDKCDSPLFDEKVAFPDVEKLTIRNMYWLKTIWHNEFHEDSFCKLEILMVEQAEALQKVFPSSMLVRRLQSLEGLFIEDCESLEEVFDIQGLMIRVEEAQVATAACTRLKILVIRNLPNLKRVWNQDPREILSFCNLNHVVIRNCPNLRSLFPASVARVLLELECLAINECGIEEIVEKEEGEETTAPAFVFPILNKLWLSTLPELKRFYPGMHTLEWPAVKFLIVYHCDKVHILETHTFRGEEELDGTQDERSLFSFKEVIPNLEELALTCDEATMMLEDQLPEKLFHNLKSLRLQCFHDKSAVLPSGFFERFPNIGKLILRCSRRTELFPYGLLGEGKNARPIPRIHKLELQIFPDARHTRRQESQIDAFVQNLESLELWKCNGLTNLAPFSASFRSITFLETAMCRALVHLFTLSTAETLVQLTNMRILDCDLLTEIVASTGHDTEHEIVFCKLESLELHHLPSLTSFCSGEHGFKFPSLSKVIVSQCPKMEIFSNGVLRTPKLQSVKLTQQGDKECRNGNLNATIQHLYKKMVGFHGLQDLRLINFPNLMDAWHSELPADCFYDLRSLVVENCASFSNAVPSSLLSFLNRLKELDVRNCDSLEEVFDLEGLNANLEHPVLSKLSSFLLSDLPRLRHVWNKASCGILEFRNLKLLKVHNCSSLKYIFTPTMALSLVQIQELEVKNCDFVGEIITSGEEEAIVDTIFSQLSSLVLESLPNLTSFCSTTDVLELQSLDKVTVIDCPRIETFASTMLGAQKPNIVDRNEERLGHEGFSTPNVLLFGSKVACRSLKELKVEWSKNMREMLRGKFPTECFAKIKVLELTNFPHDETLFPSDILVRLPYLEKLVVNDAHFGELFLEQRMVDMESNGEDVTKLRQLKLLRLPKLSQLFQDHSISDLVIQNLETLEVLECIGLKILMRSSLSFQNLTTLEVSRCHGLKILMTSSTAKSLEKLTRMSITECDMMEEIVASEGNGGEDEVAFSQLEHLGLHCLPNLVSFCSGNHTFNFPCLEEITLRECSKMKCFSEGALFTPRLTEVQMALDGDQWRWEGSLNTTVQKLFSEMCVGNARGH